MGAVESVVAAAQEALGIEVGITDAARRGDVERVRKLVEEGADVHALDEDGNESLHIACYEGWYSIVEYLVKERGVLASRRGRLGFTPLHRAVQCGHMDIASFLLEHGAGVSARNDIGVTPLHWAATWNNVSAMRMLLEQGANINAQQSNGHTPIHCAALQGNAAAVQLLLDYKCSIDAKDMEGNAAGDMAATRLVSTMLAEAADLREQEIRLAVLVE